MIITLAIGPVNNKETKMASKEILLCFVMRILEAIKVRRMAGKRNAKRSRKSSPCIPIIDRIVTAMTPLNV